MRVRKAREPACRGSPRGGPLSTSCYVWYRVRGDACEARSAVTAMMLDVAMESGVVGRLMKRADDPTTWMEVYEAIDDPLAFEQALAEAIARHGVDACAEGGRHVERFVACGALDADG